MNLNYYCTFLWSLCRFIGTIVINIKEYFHVSSFELLLSIFSKSIRTFELLSIFPALVHSNCPLSMSRSFPHCFTWTTVILIFSTLAHLNYYCRSSPRRFIWTTIINLDYLLRVGLFQLLLSILTIFFTSVNFNYLYQS